jgi:hypothetical protein
MAYLEVSKPLRPHKFGSAAGSRLVYRVVLDDKKLLTLPDLCRKLNIPYTSLSARLQGLTIGQHDEAFWAIVADVKKRAHAGRLATMKCPTCAGHGRVPKPAEVASVDPTA